MAKRKTQGLTGPDPVDRRDRRMAARKLGEPIVRKVDLRYLASPVEDQGRLSSCTANAAVGAMEILEKKQGMAQRDLSRLFVYYNTRMLEGTTNMDQGAYIRTTMKAMRKFGACLEKMWMHRPSKVLTKPNAKCYKDGMGRQVLEYLKVTRGSGIREALAEGYPVIFGMILHEGFMKVKRNGIVPMPRRGEQVYGGHAMLIVGYDLDAKMYLIRNSWGPRWGRGGYCWMPFALLDNPRVAWSFWTARLMEDDPQAPQPQPLSGRCPSCGWEPKK